MGIRLKRKNPGEGIDHRDSLLSTIDAIFIPADLVAKVEREREYQARERLRKHSQQIERQKNNPFRTHHKLDERPFVFWDGEGPKDAGYALFGNSDGLEICHPFLSTIECLELICSANPDAIHCWFGGNYDVSMIIGDLSWRQLKRLKDTNKVVYRGYRIEYVHGKWFTVSNGKTRIKIYDVRSFFGGSFISALEQFKVGPWQQISQSTVQDAKKLSDSGMSLTQMVMHLARQNKNWKMNAQTIMEDGNFGIDSKVFPSTDARPDLITAWDAVKVLSDPEIIAIFKVKRGDFEWWEIPLIRLYWKLELKYGVVLMDQLRTVFRDAGFNVRSWHGPGALARVALKRHHVELAMAKCPSPVRLAASYAFAGGRFEMVHGGFIDKTIYNADLRSAYPHYARYLPNLAKGKWRYTNVFESGKFAVYHIDYNSQATERDRVYPLFRRLENGEVVWPRSVEGWYWAPEAELVANDKEATIIEGWCFDEDDENDRPFAWIEDYFNKRMVLKNIGNPAEFTFKLIINSVYGQLAQRAGWDKKKRTSPRYHQLEWAGYITSSCRAEMYKLATTIRNEDLVSIDTDGIYSTAPLPVHPTSGLGGWDCSTYSAGLFWQSGIYSLATESGEWTNGKTKTRGIPKGTYSTEQMLDCLRKGTPLYMGRNRFIGFGLALNGQYEKMNQWVYDSFTFEFGGKGKRYHHKYMCPVYCDAEVTGVHTFIQRPVRPGLSYPHSLPWLVPDSYERLTHDDLVFFDANDLTEDDTWVWEYRDA